MTVKTKGKESRREINKKRMDLAIEVSDLSCGCLSWDIAIILGRPCPCGNACKGRGNTHIRDAGPQDENCDCDPHCGTCAGECTPGSHAIYSVYDPAWIESPGDPDYVYMGDFCPDKCGHPHDKIRRYTGEHCPPRCPMAAQK